MAWFTVEVLSSRRCTFKQVPQFSTHVLPTVRHIYHYLFLLKFLVLEYLSISLGKERCIPLETYRTTGCSCRSRMLSVAYLIHSFVVVEVYVILRKFGLYLYCASFDNFRNTQGLSCDVYQIYKDRYCVKENQV